MRLELRWEERVPRGLRTLPPADRRWVTETILSLVDNPRPPGARPLPGKPQWFRLQLGPFGILYAVHSVDSTVTVYAVTRDGEPLSGEGD